MSKMAPIRGIKLMLKATKNQNKSSGPAIWYEHAVQEKNCKDRLGVKYIQ